MDITAIKTSDIAIEFANATKRNDIELLNSSTGIKQNLRLRQLHQ